METNRKGILTEYQSSDHSLKEGKKKTDVSYLFADDYDETKTPIHYTKKRSAWTASLRRSSMHSATSRLEAYFTNSSRSSSSRINRQTSLQEPPKKQKPEYETVRFQEPVQNKKADAEIAKTNANAEISKTNTNAEIAKTKIITKIVLPEDDAKQEMAETKVIKKADTPKTQVKPAAPKKPAVKPDENPTKVIRKVVTKPVDSHDTDKDKTRTLSKKTQAASARAATSRISATRVAADMAAKAQAADRQKKEALLTDPQARPENKRTKPYQHSKKKLLWPYMIMIVSIVFIASLVTFLYLIRSSQNRFFMAIRDKDAPVLEVTDLNIYNDETVTVDDFVTVCEDESRVKVYLRSPIDFGIDGEQTVTIVAEDEVGNKTSKSVTLTHIIDQTPPRIAGDPVIRTVRGESVAYKSHISVIDEHDPDPVIEIDNSQVNLDAEGSYPVWYAATDKCGNRATFQSEVIVSAPSAETVSDEEVFALVDKILAEITTDDMQPIDKLWAIYEYVRHIPYNGRDYSFNYKYEGYKLLRDQKGECYGSYSASKLFFDRLGYENLSLEKNVGAKHYWNMVSIDGGKTFYHFDATNWHEWGPKKPVMCMISDAVLEKISEEHKGTHRYDHSLFPATPAESMPVPDYVPSKYGEDY